MSLQRARCVYTFPYVRSVYSQHATKHMHIHLNTWYCTVTKNEECTSTEHKLLRYNVMCLSQQHVRYAVIL